MSLPSGTQVGSYRVVGPLGKGGMGEVYRALDTRLGRDVAIKILPAVFTSDADRLARFDREARVLASLNHPGIAAIYGIEDAASHRALVLEFIDGGTLADQLSGAGAGRGLALPTALGLARQIAEALDAAHERGIVHRDLKPSNIGMTRAGAAKLLDFGLAKPDAADPLSSSSSLAVTAVSTIASMTGVTLLGTLAYMSPEQIRGQRVDKRADIWAFGCVLFEMLTGAGAFGRATPSDTIAGVLEREPDWSLLPRDVPSGVRRVLRRTLHKDARRRLRDIADALDDLTGADTAGELQPAAPVRARSVEFHRLTDHVGMNDSPAISPDGKMVAFVASTGGRRQIWIQLLSGGVPLQVTRSDVDHSQPRWSPSPEGGPSESVGRIAGARLPVSPLYVHPALSCDGRWLALGLADGATTNIWALSTTDGSWRKMTDFGDQPTVIARQVAWSPDGGFVFAAVSKNIGDIVMFDGLV